MKKNLNDFKEELIAKHNYDESLAETIVVVAESIVDYLGDIYEPVVLAAISECHYEIAESPNRSIDGYSKKGASLEIRPILEKNGNSYSIIDMEKRIILPHNFDIDSPASIGMILNQTLSLVQSQIEDALVVGNKVELRTGFAKRYMKIGKTGEVEESIDMVGYGLQIGITSYMEGVIMNESLSNSFYDMTNGRDYQRILAGVLMDGEMFSLKFDIIAACMTGNTEELAYMVEEHLGMSFDDFLHLVDELELLERKRAASVLDASKLESCIVELESYYKIVIAPHIGSLGAKLNGLEMGGNHLGKVA